MNAHVYAALRALLTEMGYNPADIDTVEVTVHKTDDIAFLCDMIVPNVHTARFKLAHR